MIAKTTVLAAVVLLGFLGIAEAQNTGPISQSGGYKTSSTSSDELNARVVVGWNYFHIANCSPTASMLYIVPLEAFGVSYFFTNIPTFQIGIAPACQTGNWVAVHIVDTNLNWDQFYTYTFK